jgi:uncharacterized damage-inducible protein DinB
VTSGPRFASHSDPALEEAFAMSSRIPWVERTFDFEFPAELHPEILERLRGTPARIDDRIRSVPPAILTQRDDVGWSIQENVGHLLVVEELWLGRLDDYDNDAPALRPADMSNRQTHERQFNQEPMESVLADFCRERLKLVGRLERLPPQRFGQPAHHPRLNQAMRIVDMMYFIAEHDDYHLVRISELIRKLSV